MTGQKTPTLPAGIAPDAPRVLVRGLANSGTTELARARAAALAADAESDGRVLLVVPSDVAAADARAWMGARGATGVRVACARDVEREILSTPEARAATGRSPRVMTPGEHDVLMEDMRTTGIGGRRLKGMLGFFRKSLTELADDDMASFLIDQKEVLAFGLARRCLTAYGVVSPSELAGICVRYLRGLGAAAAEATPYRHVVVDGYQSLNRASQHVLELLAPRTLWVFADPTTAAEGADPFPYLAGVREFERRNPEALVVDLPAPSADDGVRGAAALLVTSGFVGATSLGVTDSQGSEEREERYDVPAAAAPVAGVGTLCADDCQEEFAAVAARVAGLVEQGARQCDVAVLAPNRTWRRHVAAALRAAGVPVRERLGAGLAGGDIRALDRCRGARALCALMLVADPTDPMALRAWCGFGDDLARSAVFAELVDAWAAAGEPLDAQLAALAAGDAGAQGIAHAAAAQAWRDAHAMADELRDLRGAALLDAVADRLGGALDDALRAACLAAGEDADAAAMADALREAVLTDAVMGDDDGVLVCDTRATAGLTRAHVILAGMMNGWFPDHAYFDPAEASFERRIALDAACRADMYRLAGTATETLDVSSFSTCSLRLAETMGLREYRIFADGRGGRAVSCHRSLIAEYALDAWGVRRLDPEDARRQVRP